MDHRHYCHIFLDSTAETLSQRLLTKGQMDLNSPEYLKDRTKFSVASAKFNLPTSGSNNPMIRFNSKKVQNWILNTLFLGN